MWGWVWAFVKALAISIVLGMVTTAIQLRRAKRTKYTLSDFSYPTTDQARPFIRVFGRVPIAGSLNWWGNYRAIEKRKKVRVIGIKVGSQTTGFEHYMSMWLSLAGHPVQRVRAVWYGKHKVWSGSLELSKTGPTSLTVNSRWAEQEGQEVLSGLAGEFVFWNLERKLGDTTELPVDQVLAGWLGESPPMYANTCHCRFDGFVGASTSLSELRIELEDHTLPRALFDAGSRTITFPMEGVLSELMADGALDTWIEATREVDGGANPVFVAAEILTRQDPAFGARITPYLLDFDAWMRAADQVKQQNILGVDFAWETTSSSDEQLKGLMALVNGHIDHHPETGLLDCRVVREDDDYDAEFEPRHITRIGKFTRTALPQMPNSFVVSYADREADYESKPVRATNPAGVRAAGREILQEVDYVGLSTSKRAAYLASRLKRSGVSSLFTGDFSAVLPAGATPLRPSSRILFPHPTEGPIVMRVLSVAQGGYDSRQEVDVEAIEDIFRDGDAASIGVPAAPLPPDTGAVPSNALAASAVFYAPPYLVDSQQDQAMVIAAPSTAEQRTFRVDMADTTGLTYSDEESATVPGRPGFAAKGTLSSAAAHNAYSLAVGLPEASFAVYERNASKTNVLVILGDPTAESGYEWARASTIAEDDEGAVTVTLGERGLFGTWPLQHAAGTAVWLVYGHALDPSYLDTVLTTGATFAEEGEPPAKWSGYAFAQPWLFTSNAYRENPEPVRLDTLAAPNDEAGSPTRAARPYNAGLVRINDTEGAYVKTGTLPSVSGPLTVTWTNRNKAINGLSAYDAAGGDGSPAANTRCRVLVARQAPGAGSWTEVHNSVVDNGSTSIGGIAPGGSSGHILRVMVRTEEQVGDKWVWPAAVPMDDGQLDYEAAPGRARYYQVA